jgi:hypothetical protein
LPRGLGDNPLKREKKSRRAGAQDATTNAAASSGPDARSDVTMGVTETESVYASSSSSRSYNDVFFHRRPENSGAAANSVPETSHSDGSSASAPIAAAEAFSTPGTPEMAAIAVEPASLDVVAATPVSTPVLIAEPAPVAITAPEINSAPQPSIFVETASPQEAKSGFFGRIFGRLRK